MHVKCIILKPNKFKDKPGVSGKKSSQKKTEKSRQKDIKKTERGDWRPCYQRDRAPLKGMGPPRRLRVSSSQLMEPLYAL
jgi:hypothetical protein